MAIGEIAALATAATYASSSTIACHTIKYTTPTMMNFLRGILCSMLMCCLLLITTGAVIPSCSFRVFLLLTLSGILGIGIGDSFFLKALSQIGTRKTLLLETLAPPFTGIVSYFYSGTTLSLAGWAGMCITAAGIFIVINEKESEQKESNCLPLISDQISVTELLDFSYEESITPPRRQKPSHSNNKSEEIQMPTTNNSSSSSNCTQKKPKNNFWELFSESSNQTELKGILNGLLFNVCQAMGMVLSHDAAQSNEFTSLQTSFLRIVMGTLSLGLVLLLTKENMAWPWQTTKLNCLFACGVLLVPFTGIWTQQLAVANTRPEIAQTIIATTPLFGLFISYFKGETIKAQYIIGSIIAVAGVAIIVWV